MFNQHTNVCFFLEPFFPLSCLTSLKIDLVHILLFFSIHFSMPVTLFFSVAWVLW
jgi:hypothetical protein